MMTVTLTLALTMREMTTEELGMTLRRIPREMPLRYSHQLRKFHRRRRPTRWSSPRPPQHLLNFHASTFS
jgi:hypothetical protein